MSCDSAAYWVEPEVAYTISESRTDSYYTDDAKLNWHPVTGREVFVKVMEGGQAPTRGTPESVGYDLYAAEDVSISNDGRCVKVPCNFAFTPPKGYFGMIKGRSGLTVNKHLDVGAGVIDPDYTGNVQVAMFNHGPDTYQVMKGDKVAQLIFLAYCAPEVVIVDELTTTKRGDGGFGSTGK